MATQSYDLGFAAAVRDAEERELALLPLDCRRCRPPAKPCGRCPLHCEAGEATCRAEVALGEGEP